MTFEPAGRPPVFGMLTRYNRKTVTVITDDGQHLNVSPMLLRKVESVRDTRSNEADIIPLKQK